MNPTLQKLQKILPSPLFFLLSEHSEPPEELRMRVGHPVILKQWGRCALTHLVCTEDLMKETLSCCTNRSFYNTAYKRESGCFPALVFFFSLCYTEPAAKPTKGERKK